jgi:hypothetical protein
MSKDPSKPAAPAAPATSKAKPTPRGPATKAEHAAMKRIDKMVIKRMRKR